MVWTWPSITPLSDQIMVQYNLHFVGDFVVCSRSSHERWVGFITGLTFYRNLACLRRSGSRSCRSLSRKFSSCYETFLVLGVLVVSSDKENRKWLNVVYSRIWQRHPWIHRDLKISQPNLGLESELLLLNFQMPGLPQSIREYALRKSEWKPWWKCRVVGKLRRKSR